MENYEIFKEINNGRAILLTGSGAHIGVKDPMGCEFPSGAALAGRLYKAAGIENPENVYDLQDASESFLECKTSIDMIEEIKRILTVSTVTQTTKKLYSCPWKRVYTTNYDNVPRISTSDLENPLLPRTLGDTYDASLLEKRLCIYINGYVDKLTPETLNNEFKLTAKSYMSANYINDSQWGALFAEDIETSGCIVIAGLSLEYDLDIKRFLYNKEVKAKTVFIEAEEISDDKLRKLRRLGEVKTVGIDSFTNELCEYISTHKRPNEFTIMPLYSFEEYVPNNICTNRMTSIEIHKFLLTGNYMGNHDLWRRERGRYINIIYRKKIKDVIESISTGIKVIYIHANLGNGKTFFIEALKNQLKNEKYSIFTLRELHFSRISTDIDRIMSQKGKK